jgi:MFS family permease
MARAEEQGRDVAAAVASRPRVLPDLTALRYREYRLLWSGMLAMSALMPLQFTTMLLYLQDTAPENVRFLLTGLFAAVRGGVMLFAGIPGGALADRFDRRRLLIAAQSGAILANSAIAFLMLTTDGSAAALAGMLALTVVSAAAMTVDTPARQALVPQLVPRERLANAIALDAVAMQLAFPLSLPLVGILIETVGFGGAYAASLLGHATVLLMLFQMRVRGGARATRKRTSLFAEMREGLRYTRRSPTVLWLIVLLLSVMAVGFPAVGTLGPVWVTQVLDVSPAKFGFFGALWGLGAMLASIAMTNAGHFPRKGRLVAGAALTFSGCVVIWAYSRSVPLSAVLNMVLGGSLVVMQVSARSLVQRIVPNAIQGRVLSLFMLNMGLSQFMAGPVGALYQAFGIEQVVPVLGWLSLTLALTIVLTRPSIRRADLATVADS